MPKTKRLITMYGSTLDPIYRYMTQATLNISPFDINGNKVAKFLYTNFAGGDQRLKLPDFKLDVKFNNEVKNTYLEATYSDLIRKQLEEHLRANGQDLSHATFASERVQLGSRV